MPMMNKQGPTVGKYVMGPGEVLWHLPNRGGCFCIAGCTPGQVSCPLLALAQGGCWCHREPGLVLV